jgi:endonuclease/exonuclease/phosphatase family metal-dependent hydrolase
MFRVLQFNMQFGQGWALEKPHYGKINLGDTIAEIRRHDADIVLLQEVEHARRDGAQLNPPPNYTRLLAGLGLSHGWFAYPKADPRELPFGVGLAILSRTSLRDTTRLDLPSPPINFRFEGKTMTPTDRLLIGAKTTIEGREIQLFNTHLLAFFMLGTSSAAHPQQREMVAQQLASSPVPAILAGDFNVRSHADLVAQFASLGFRTAQDKTATWRRKPYVFDHIFFNNAFRLMNQQVIPTLASDHHVVIADFEFA